MKAQRIRRIWGAALVAMTLASLPLPLRAQAAQRAILAARLRDELAAIARGTPGVMGAEVVDLTSGERFGVNDTLVFPQGSAIKIPLLVELYAQAEAGRISLEERLPVRRAEQVGGSGVVQGFGDGTSLLSLHDLAILMIVLSDNTATNMLIGRVGMDAVNARMAALGYPHILLRRRMIRPEDLALGNENVATAVEAAALMGRLARCELPFSAARCRELRSILEIPKEGPLPQPIPAGVPVAWKPGSVEGVGTAWGLVGLPGRPYVVVVMVNYSDGAAADAAIRRTSAAALLYFSRLAGATPFGARVSPALLDRVTPRP
jgi:beta-lactamase class A